MNDENIDSTIYFKPGMTFEFSDIVLKIGVEEAILTTPILRALQKAIMRSQLDPLVEDYSAREWLDAICSYLVIKNG